MLFRPTGTGNPSHSVIAIQKGLISFVSLWFVRVRVYVRACVHPSVRPCLGSVRASTAPLLFPPLVFFSSVLYCTVLLYVQSP